MSKTFYARLQLSLDGQAAIPANPKGIFAPVYLKRFTYKLKIAPKPGVKISHGERTFSGGFTKLQSADHELETVGTTLDTLAEVNAKFNVTWEIFFDGKLKHSVSGKMLDRPKRASKDWNRLNIKFTKSTTKWNMGGPANVTTQAISSGVGWYWIKRPETFGDLMKRAFIKPDQANWDAMKDVNGHLGTISTMTVLKRGQIVIFSKTKDSSNPKLQQMKTAAKSAQAAWVQANADGKVDQAEMLLIDLLMNGHNLIGIDANDIEGIDKTALANALSITDDYKKYPDGMMGLAGVNFEIANEARDELAKIAKDIPYTTEKGTIKRATRDAAHTKPKAFKLLNDSSFARQLIRWDDGIKANRARDYIRTEVQVRSANLNGGIDAAAEGIKKAGKISKFLKGTGYVGIAIDATSTGINAHAAYKSGDTKAGNIEVGKGVGSIAFGIGGGALAGAAAGSVLLVFGIATGGVGLVVIGAAAAVAGYGAGEVGKAAGEWSANKINEQIFR